MNSFGGNGVGGLTAAAGTRIRFLIPPVVRGYTRITKLVYTAGATAHTLTVPRPIGKTTANGSAAAAQAVINLTADPGPTGNLIQANDLLAIRETDGVTRLYIVSSVATLAITLTTNLVAGVANLASVWNFGILGDTDPITGRAHPTLRGIVLVTTTYEDREGGVIAGHEVDSPVLVDSDNATNAGVLEQLSWSYTRE